MMPANGGRAFKNDSPTTKRLLGISIALGGFFVLFQGAEWVALIGEGLTLTSGQLGGYFYLLVGVHALHVVAGFLILLYTYRRLSQHNLDRFTFSGAAEWNRLDLLKKLRPYILCFPSVGTSIVFTGDFWISSSTGGYPMCVPNMITK